MIKLPKWRLTNPFPAFLDGESGTAIEQTAKVYGAMQELTDEYNAFVRETEEKIDTFIAETNEEQEVFATALRQEFQDFIDVVDIKLGEAKGEQEALERSIRQELLDLLDVVDIKLTLASAGEETSVIGLRRLKDTITNPFDEILYPLEFSFDSSALRGYAGFEDLPDNVVCSGIHVSTDKDVETGEPFTNVIYIIPNSDVIAIGALGRDGWTYNGALRTINVIQCKDLKAMAWLLENTEAV